MNKRRLKVNALDIALLILIVSAALIIVFRAEINDFFAEPEESEVILTVSADAVEIATANRFRTGARISVCFGDDSDNPLDAVIESAVVTPDGEDGTARLIITFSVNGYRRFGIFYTNEGKKLSDNSAVTVIRSEVELPMAILSAEFADTSVQQ